MQVWSSSSFGSDTIILDRALGTGDTKSLFSSLTISAPVARPAPMIERMPPVPTPLLLN